MLKDTGGICVDDRYCIQSCPLLIHDGILLKNTYKCDFICTTIKQILGDCAQSTRKSYCQGGKNLRGGGLKNFGMGGREQALMRGTRYNPLIGESLPPPPPYWTALTVPVSSVTKYKIGPCITGQNRTLIRPLFSLKSDQNRLKQG